MFSSTSSATKSSQQALKLSEPVEATNGVIGLLSRLLAPLATALLREPPVRRALVRAIAEQEEAEQAVRERLLLAEQTRRSNTFSTWLTTAGNRTP